MIPVSLEFSGLNSYRDQQSIDFSQLMFQGLFGIFGVTGAGKSTVLDAMTLALFGQVNRAPRQTQGIINAREKRCRVRFAFRLSGHLYEAERVFERTKGEPYACAAKSCRLVEDRERVLADKNRVMDQEIKNLLNMDCERFCQTVILPQGKFDRLLHMEPRKRAEMLEELFRYQDYGGALVRRCSERLRLAEAEVSGIEEKLNMLSPCGEADLEQLRQELARTEKSITAVSEQLSQAETKRNGLRELAAREQERQRCRQELEKLEAEAEEIAALRQEAERAQAAEPLRRSLDDAAAVNAQLKDCAQQWETADAGEKEARAVNERRAADAEARSRELRERKDEIEPQLRRLELAIHGKEAAARSAQDLEQARRQLDISALEKKQARAEQRLKEIGARQRQLEQDVSSAKAEEKVAFAAYEQARSHYEQARIDNAAALLARDLQEGRPCPVCGSIHHQPREHQAADLDAAAAAAGRSRQEWQKRRQRLESLEQEAQDLSGQAAGEQQAADQDRERLQEVRSRLYALEKTAADQDAAWRQLTDCDDPAAEHQRLEQSLKKLAAAAEDAADAAERSQSRLQAAVLAAEKAKAMRESSERRLAELKENLLQAVAAAGFASAAEARKALRDQSLRREIAAKVKAFDDELLRQQHERGRLDQLLRDFDAAALQPAQAEVERLLAEQGGLLDNRGRLSQRLEQAEKDAEQAAALSDRREQALSRAQTLRRLSNLLKGNAFVRYLARGTMLELAHESSGILLDLTAGRYRLELDEDGGSDFILVDNNGGLRRQISGLSGGETFLVSLALALALSGKIQMHAAPLGFFFLDEGFGSLDGASLEAAMAVLEKLPSDQRAVGLITHVREVRERVPRYLEVIPDPVRGSRIELRKN